MNMATSTNLVICGAVLLAVAAAQDIKLNVRYVCDGEHIYVENCNIRDTSDTSNCMVAHPDRPTKNGLMAYTYETRGTLKKLFPTCQQPSAQELAKAEAFKKKQQEIYDAKVKAANPQPVATATAPAPAAGIPSAANVRPPKNAEERAIRRCISSGRIAATCTGNLLLGAFSQMITSVAPGLVKEAGPGPDIAGVYEGAGGWNIDFIDEGVLVNCGVLAPDQHKYSIEFKNNRATVVIDTTPKPLVLSLGPDGKTMTAPGPFTIDGVIVTGYDSGVRDRFGNAVPNPAMATGPLYDSSGNRISRSANVGHATFAPKRVTCPALNLVNKGKAGVLTMQTDLLKSMFNDGDKGPPTPPGIRMHGIFAAASTGFSVQFFPESAILGCGPDSARAYPYSVVADGTKSFIKIDAPDHPLTLAFRPDGSLDPGGTEPYQVHGRIAIGQDDKGDFTFAPMEQTCNLAPLAPSKQIPSSGGTAAAPVSTLSVPDKPLGNATLSIVSGFAAAPNPLAGRPYILLRDAYGEVLAKAGVSVPKGMSPYKYAGTACGTRTPDCQKINEAVKANAASAVRADASGSGTFPGVPPGTYYLMIFATYNNQQLVWGQAVQLKAGQNSLKLDQSNAVPLN